MQTWATGGKRLHSTAFGSLKGTPRYVSSATGAQSGCACARQQRKHPTPFGSIQDHLEIARILLKYNADVNSQNHHSSTPLLLASECGTPDLVQLFLDHNADLNACDGDGDTPLHCAALGGQLEVVRLLLKLNVEVNSRNNKGSTPLHLASAGYWEGNPDIVRLLLEHDAEVQAHNLSGQTASDVARGSEQQEIVQLLSQLGQHAAE